MNYTFNVISKDTALFERTLFKISTVKKCVDFISQFVEVYTSNGEFVLSLYSALEFSIFLKSADENLSINVFRYVYYASFRVNRLIDPDESIGEGVANGVITVLEGRARNVTHKFNYDYFNTYKSFTGWDRLVSGSDTLLTVGGANDEFLLIGGKPRPFLPDIGLHGYTNTLFKLATDKAYTDSIFESLINTGHVTIICDKSAAKRVLPTADALTLLERGVDLTVIQMDIFGVFQVDTCVSPVEFTNLRTHHANWRYRFDATSGLSPKKYVYAVHEKRPHGAIWELAALDLSSVNYDKYRVAIMNKAEYVVTVINNIAEAAVATKVISHADADLWAFISRPGHEYAYPIDPSTIEESTFSNGPVFVKVVSEDKVHADMFNTYDGYFSWLNSNERLIWKDAKVATEKWEPHEEQKELTESNVAAKVSEAVDPGHYKSYIYDLEWIEAQSLIPTLRAKDKFMAALELQLRKYLDRRGGKDESRQELRKALVYLMLMIQWEESSELNIKQVHRIVKDFK